MSEGHGLPETRAAGITPGRLLRPWIGQVRRTRRCPSKPRLEGQVALVTGATSGIGVEIARGLARRGADLVLPCRSLPKGQRVAEGIRSEAPSRVSVVQLELADLESIGPAVDAIEQALDGRRLALLVENAGVWPQRHATTRQGHELAFGVNVLAHFALRRALRERGLLREGRVVVLTGDIYVLARDCTPDYAWHGRLGGMRAYCRSKLGNLWIAGELARRAPELEVYVAHPGVVATHLGGSFGDLGDRLRRRFFLSPELGAQTPLWCATQEGLERGGYYHNTAGLMRLTPRDPASNPEAAAKLWETCEALAK